MKFLFLSKALFSFQDPGPRSNSDIFSVIEFEAWSESEVAEFIQHLDTLFVKCEEIYALFKRADHVFLFLEMLK